MKRRLRFPAAVVLSVILASGLCGRAIADDSETKGRLTLTDLAGYRAALSGKPTADQSRAGTPPIRVTFKDLWNHNESLRGRRVTVRGRVSRIFRQGPVGSFPSLAEVWIASPVGDPFCVVFPQPESHQNSDPELRTALEAVVGGMAAPATEDHRPAVHAPAIAGLGRPVRFTGTFLKMVRYEAGDGGRLAPLVVGDQPPASLSGEAETDSSSPVESTATVSPVGGSSQTGVGIKIAYWTIGLVLGGLGAVILARRHLLAPVPTGVGRNATSSFVSDSSLEFIEPSDFRGA
jgi:hypothetical protein